MRYRVLVGDVFWTEAETLRDAQGTAMREAGALAASLWMARGGAGDRPRRGVLWGCPWAGDW